MKFGVLGYGKIVRTELAPAFAEAGHPIVAVGSRSGQRPDGFEGTVHASYSDCIQDPEVEAIYIATPNHLHVPLSIEAMQAGKPVLCEKPVAMNGADFERLKKAQVASGSTLMEAFMVQHHPQWERIAEHPWGQQKLLHTSFTYGPRLDTDVRSKAELGGGVWLDIGCYGLWACYQFGARQLKSVSGNFREQQGCCVHAQVTLHFDELDAQIEVGGLHFRQQSLTLTTDRERLQVTRPFNPLGETINTYQTDDELTQWHDQANQYARMIEYFVEHADSGQFLYEERSALIAQWSDRIVTTLK